MRAIFAFVAVAILGLSLAGCGGSDNKSSINIKTPDGKETKIEVKK